MFEVIGRATGYVRRDFTVVDATEDATWTDSRAGPLNGTPTVTEQPCCFGTTISTVPVSPRPVFPLFAAIGVAFIVVQDALNTTLGVQGAATLGLVGLVLLMFIKAKTTSPDHEAPNGRHAWPPAFLWAFVVWAAAGFVIEPTTEGLQHLSVWFLLPAVAAIIAMKATTNTLRVVYPYWRGAAIAAAGIYIVMTMLSGPGVTGFPYSERGAGWVLVSAMTLLFAKAIFEKESLWVLAFVGAAIVLSLSRTPIAIMLGLTAILIVAGRDRSSKERNPWFVRTLLAGTAAIAGVVYLFTSFTSISNRFSQGDGYTLYGIEINASGRDRIWSHTIELWQRDVWFGNGPGASQRYLTDVYGGRIAHPHNEFLRLLADTGVIGMALWVLGIAALLYGAIKRLRAASLPQDRTIHGAAILSILVILGSSVTDNITISVFQIVMFGAIFGLSMSRANDTEPARSPRPTRPLEGAR